MINSPLDVLYKPRLIRFPDGFQLSGFGVIVGVSKSEPSQCLLYSDDHKRIVSSISPYLVPG
ncbi:MAG: hypothetical protein AAF316_06840, partial [Cyanobacteria bacterium P01_A01_bin.80]